jgi:hypothetical protein
MAKLTINGTLQLITQVSKRLADLRMIRSQGINKSKTTYGTGEHQRIEESECQYDTKELDKRVTMLENWLFKANTAVKQANATTIVDLEVDSDSLLAPLE